MNTSPKRHIWSHHGLLDIEFLDKKSAGEKSVNKIMVKRPKDIFLDAFFCLYLRLHLHCQSASCRKASAQSCSICRVRWERWVAAGLLPALLPAPQCTWALLKTTHTDKKISKTAETVMVKTPVTVLCGHLQSLQIDKHPRTSKVLLIGTK